MKGMLFGIFALLVTGSSLGQIHPVTSESTIGFTIKNFGFKTKGKLAAPQGDIRFHPDSLSSAYFKITVSAASIDTDNESRDSHLKEEDYFDTGKYPDIKFVSSKIQSSKKGMYEALGTLTIKNTSKEIRLPFTAEKKGTGYLFAGSFAMNRRDFNIGGGSTISNELTVDISVTAR